MYNAQILALQAAASINADGTTPITYGCSITRISTGLYKLILPTNLGIVDAQSFTRVTGKGPFGMACVVSDETFHLKTITMFDNTGAVPVDSGIEVSVHRSTVNPY